MLIDRLKTILTRGEGEASDPAERRADVRRRVLLKAEIYPITGYANMTVRNVSEKGLAAGTAAKINAPGLLLFTIDGMAYHPGRVIWSRKPRFGLDLQDAFAIFGPEKEADPGFLTSHLSRARNLGPARSHEQGLFFGIRPPEAVAGLKRAVRRPKDSLREDRWAILARSAPLTI